MYWEKPGVDYTLLYLKLVWFFSLSNSLSEEQLVFNLSKPGESMFSCWRESAVLQYSVNGCFSFSHHWMKRSMQWQIGSIDHLSDQLSFHLSLFQVAVNPVLTCHWCLYSLAVIFQCKKGPQLYMRLRNVCVNLQVKKKVGGCIL